jgi:hypothetical protein
MKQMICFCVIAAGLAVPVSACTGLQDVLCRPAGHCPDAPDGINKDNS